MLTQIVIGALVVGVVVLLVRGQSGERISSQDARKMVSEGAKLVDLRSPSEFASDHIEGAVNIPLQQLPKRMGELGPMTQPIVVYCHSGARSARARSQLMETGYSEVHNLGPMSAWN
jgi:phage shock protein E